MYKELTIENIKTFEKEQKLKIAPMTLIYGENSSGKTTLLKTFDIVHNIFAEYQVKQGKNVSEKGNWFNRRKDIENISARRIDSFSSQLNKKPIKIEINFNLPFDKIYSDLSLQFIDVAKKDIFINPYGNPIFSPQSISQQRMAKRYVTDLKAKKSEKFSVPIKIQVVIKHYPSKKTNKVQSIIIKRNDDKTIISFERINKKYKRIVDPDEVGWMSEGYRRMLTASAASGRSRRFGGPSKHGAYDFVAGRRAFEIKRFGGPSTEPDYFVDESLYADYKIKTTKENFIWKKNYNAYEKIFSDDKNIKYRLEKIRILFHFLMRFKYQDSKILAHHPKHPDPNIKTTYKVFAYYITNHLLSIWESQDINFVKDKLENDYNNIRNKTWCAGIETLFSVDTKKFHRIDIRKLTKRDNLFIENYLFARSLTESIDINFILLNNFLKERKTLNAFHKSFTMDLDELFNIRFYKRSSNSACTLVRNGRRTKSSSDILYQVCNFINGGLSNVFYKELAISLPENIRAFPYASAYDESTIPKFKENFTHNLLNRCIAEVRKTVNGFVICHPNKTEVPYDVPSEADYPPSFWESLSLIKNRKQFRKELAKQDEDVRQRFLKSARSDDRRLVQEPHKILADGSNFDRVIINNKKVRKELNKVLKEALNLEVKVVTPAFLKKILKDPNQYRAFRTMQRSLMEHRTGSGGYSRNKFIMLRDLYFNKHFLVHGREVGKGPANILPFLTQILSERANLTYLVQELENNWHPKFQAKIMEVIANKLIKSKNKHFILETHSELFILQVKKLVQKGLLKPEDVSINYISRSKQGESKVHHIPVNSQGGFEKPWPGGFFPERMGVITS